MVLTIELPAEVEADLAVLAADRGQSLAQLVQSVLAERVGQQSSRHQASDVRSVLWRDAALTIDHLPPLSDFAVSRDSLYSEID